MAALALHGCDHRADPKAWGSNTPAKGRKGGHGCREGGVSSRHIRPSHRHPMPPNSEFPGTVGTGKGANSRERLCWDKGNCAQSSPRPRGTAQQALPKYRRHRSRNFGGLSWLLSVGVQISARPVAGRPPNLRLRPGRLTTELHQQRLRFRRLCEGRVEISATGC